MARILIHQYHDPKGTIAIASLMWGNRLGEQASPNVANIDLFEVCE